MKYQDIRASIQSGDLIAQSSGDWLSWHGIKVNIVRMFTRSTYSHVGLAWVIGGRVFILEAVKPKLRIYPLSKIGDFYHLKMDAAWHPETEEYALSVIGEDYSEGEAIQSFFHPTEKTEVNQCAAYVLSVLHKDGIDLGDKAIPDTVVRRAMEIGSYNSFVLNR